MPLPATPPNPLTSLVLLATLLVAHPSFASVGFAVGDTLPPIVAADQEGQSYALASLHGRWVFLDFCASWCPPCNAMGQEAQAVYDTFGDGSLLLFEYLSALIQGPGAAASTQADAQAWASAHALSRPILHDGGIAAASPQFDFVHAGFTSVPTGLILDPGGVVRDVTVGYQSPSDLVGRLSQLAGLPEPPPPPPPPVLPDCPSLAGASLAVTIGGITDTSPVTETGQALLRYGSWGGAFGQAEIGVIESDPMDIDQEALQVTFGNADLTPIPRDQAITLDLGAMSWPDGLPRVASPANPLAQLDVYVDLGDGNFDIVPTSGLLPEAHPDGHSLRIGPFTLGAIAGMPQGVFAVDAHAIVMRDYSVATLGVTPRDEGAARLALSAPWPNPARAVAVLRWNAAPGAASTLEVVDVSGRRVATPPVLRDGVAGGRSVWNLRDGSGRRVSPGIYWARVTSGTESAVRRIVVVN